MGSWMLECSWLLELNTNRGVHGARVNTRHLSGSPPRLRRPPRPMPWTELHSLIPVVSPASKPSCRSVKEIQTGRARSQNSNCEA
jgi:hypothetical protein